MLVQILVNCEVKGATSEEEAAGKANTIVWALLRASSTGSGVKAIRTEDTLWKCSKCGHVIAWPYDAMADAGNPICCAEDCEEEMERV